MGLKIWAASVALILSGCTNQTVKTEKPYYNYHPEMQIGLGGRHYRGLAATKLSGPIAIQITSPITLDRVEFSTPGRHEVIRNFDPGWFSDVTKVMTYNYVPTAYEMETNASLHIQAFSSGVQKAWGMVMFRQEEQLKGHIDCNGEGWNYSGVSVCATKAGLEQQLKFEVPVIYEAGPNCTIKQSEDKKSFLVRSGIGWCRAVFSDSQNFHTLDLLGYDEVINY